MIESGIIDSRAMKNLLRQLFFRAWYYRRPPWDTNQTPPELLDFIASHPPGRALDLGCGTGTNVLALAQNGWQATGVDFVPRAIRAARGKARRAGMTAGQVEFRVDDVTRLTGISGPFELILDIGCFHSLSPQGMARYRANLRRLLAPGGTFLLYLFFRSQGSACGSQATESDLEPFSEFLTLVNRQDSTERGLFKSSWLTFEDDGLRQARGEA